MPPPPAAKPEAPAAPPPAAKPDKAAPPPPQPAPDLSASAAKSGGVKAWLPTIVSIVVAPAVTFAVAQFVIVPKLQKKLSLPVAPAAENTGKEAGKEKKEVPTYSGFQNIVVNLSGTMGTRYLKVSMLVLGDKDKSPDLPKIFDENKPMLYDVTINILSSLTLSDLEEPGSKNVVREKLISAYNQALKKQVAEQVYFSEFVVQ